jgi:large subunit ribosomal protein L13
VSLFEGREKLIDLKLRIVDHQSYKTTHANQAAIEKAWVLVDAQDQVLGRVASQIAHIIKGKHKTSYSPHLDCGDHVVVINAEKVKMTGKKWTDRVIFTHSGYPGGQREHTPANIRAKHPERLVEHAVRGMLPKNRLGRQLFRSLHVYVGAEHPHAAQQPKEIKL